MVCVKDLSGTPGPGAGGVRGAVVRSPCSTCCWQRRAARRFRTPISELGAARGRVNSVSISSAEATALYQTERGQQQFEPTRPPDADDAVLAEHAGPLAQLAGRHQATPVQIALALLLGRSPVMPPRPGTGSIEHLEENLGPTRIEALPG